MIRLVALSARHRVGSIPKLPAVGFAEHLTDRRGVAEQCDSYQRSWKASDFPQIFF